MNRGTQFDALYESAREIVAQDCRSDVRLKKICRLLSSSVEYYDWVGFYISETARRELVLGPYVGTPTDHIRIPYGRGICGQAADVKGTVLVQDVSRESNYISCSIHVRAEIVVPVIRNDIVVAELDIDSHTPSPFTFKDEEFLGSIASLVEPII